MNPSVAEAARLWTLAVPAVSAYVTSLVRGFQDRDDVLQDVAVAVIEHFDRYDRNQPFLPWAMAIARNHVRLHFRRKARSRLVFDDLAVEALADAFSHQTQAAPLELDGLAECFSKLDEKAQNLCRLRYEDDLKPAEIGQRIGVAPNAAAKALQRIRDRLRECIERKAASQAQS